MFSVHKACSHPGHGIELKDEGDRYLSFDTDNDGSYLVSVEEDPGKPGEYDCPSWTHPIDITRPQGMSAVKEIANRKFLRRKIPVLVKGP